MPMAKDYYKILGVSKNASPEVIKQAYRKLAHQYHPDKNSGSDGARFKEINEAYQILSNPQKKAQYDQFGTTEDQAYSWGQERGSDFRDFSGFSDARDFGFGLGDIFEDFFGNMFSQVQSELEINFTSAILGDRIDLQTSQGEKIVLEIPPGTQNGQSFRFKGKGLPSKRGRGDLVITVHLKMPRSLSQEQKELLEKLRQTGI